MNRINVVNKSKSYLGKGITSIQSIYNSINPPPVGYKLKLRTGSWPLQEE